MKILSFNKLSKLEIITCLILVVYLFMDREPPMYVKKVMSSKYGIALLGLLLILLICFSNPLVTILFIFAAYELVRKVTDEGFEEEEDEEGIEDGEEEDEEGFEDGGEEEVDAQMALDEQFINGGDSLEENVVSEMAPVGEGSVMDYKLTKYKPVEGNLSGTSLVM